MKQSDNQAFTFVCQRLPPSFQHDVHNDTNLELSDLALEGNVGLNSLQVEVVANSALNSMITSPSQEVYYFWHILFVIEIPRIFLEIGGNLREFQGVFDILNEWKSMKKSLLLLF